MPLKKYTDVVIACIFILFGIGLYYLSTLYTNPFSMGIGMPSEGYPQFLAFLLVAASIALIIENLIKKESFEFNVTKKLPISIGAFIVYTLILKPLGFVFATPILLAFVMIVAGERDIKRLLAIPSALSVIVMTLVFYGFNILLPLGVLSFIFE